MRPVERGEILDFLSYEDVRNAIRERTMAIKEKRRVVVGGVLTFLFENHDTVRYQVLEMVRTERLVRESDIQHELDTYNELLGRDGDLGCTLLVGIADPEERDRRLREWLNLIPTLYVELEDGQRIAPTHDARQISEDRLSSVQFLKFPTSGRVPVAVGCELEELQARTVLEPWTREALAADVAS
ncbi:MAG: DUF3501 family protein [Planctomycetes bacterium]|nr:DUF3501 family protein [Planctomycetota bacterium]